MIDQIGGGERGQLENIMVEGYNVKAVFSTMRLLCNWNQRN